jgi:hypothetical protein
VVADLKSTALTGLSRPPSEIPDELFKRARVLASVLRAIVADGEPFT